MIEDLEAIENNFFIGDFAFSTTINFTRITRALPAHMASKTKFLPKKTGARRKLSFLKKARRTL